MISQIIVFGDKKNPKLHSATPGLICKQISLLNFDLFFYFILRFIDGDV